MPNLHLKILVLTCRSIMQILTSIGYLVVTRGRSMTFLVAVFVKLLIPSVFIQTCKALHHVASARIVWIEALGRVCRDNMVFLPTFPISSMSDPELKRAATGPQRWIESLTSGKRDPDGVVCPRKKQKLHWKSVTGPIPVHTERSTVQAIYLVPGGRYLVMMMFDWLGVWDLGVDTGNDMSSESKVLAYAQCNVSKAFCVHTTPDESGLRIFVESFLCDELNVFEIFPDSDKPKLARIAHLERQGPRYIALSAVPRSSNLL
ncbi:hypothetical protein B0H34DRAFT_114626 [Crassisporium funariophilum]|nr:hypothetical protein B0H34DRAFT_114626 [Crassisporium funariophilum]